MLIRSNFITIFFISTQWVPRGRLDYGPIRIEIMIKKSKSESDLRFWNRNRDLNRSIFDFGLKSQNRELNRRFTVQWRFSDGSDYSMAVRGSMEVQGRFGWFVGSSVKKNYYYYFFKKKPNLNRSNWSEIARNRNRHLNHPKHGSGSVLINLNRRIADFSPKPKSARPEVRSTKRISSIKNFHNDI